MEIFISSEMRQQYLELVQFLFVEFGDQTTTQFRKIFREKLMLVSGVPGIGQQFSEDSELRSFPINPISKAIFKLSGTGRIEFLYLWDNRRDPLNFPKL